MAARKAPVARAKHSGGVKDILVALDGGKDDDARLTAANAVAAHFQGRVTALYLNALPVVVAGDEAGYAGGDMVKYAREAGDKVEAKLRRRLAGSRGKITLRRLDVWNDTVANAAAREARAADTFIALRPNGRARPGDALIEGVLFGSGRHLLLVPEKTRTLGKFDHVLVAWNGSRESARALTEALPYLQQATRVTVLSIVDDEGGEDRKLGADAVAHLAHHGVKASLVHAKSRNGDIAAAILGEARKRKPDLIVMGGYGHSRLREWLLGGVTGKLLHNAPVPLLLAH